MDRFLYFLQKHNYKIYDFQKEIISLIEEFQYSVFPKSRQMYMSTLMQYYCAFKLIEAESIGKQFKIALFTPSQEMAKHFIMSVRNILHNNECNLEHNASTSLNLNDDVLIKRCNMLIGKKYDLIVFDEADYVKDFLNFINVLPLYLNENGKSVIYSSPTSKDSNILSLASKRETMSKNWNFRFIHYSLNPNYTSEKIEGLKKMLKKEKFEIEMDLNTENSKKTGETKIEVLTFRTDKEFKNKIYSRLYELSEEKGDIINFSDYIRNLIESDLNKSSL